MNHNSDDDIQFGLLTEGLGFQKSLLRENAHPKEKALRPPATPPQLRTEASSSSLLSARGVMSLDDKKNLLRTSFQKQAAAVDSAIEVERDLLDDRPVTLPTQLLAWVVDFLLVSLVVAVALYALTSAVPGIWNNAQGKLALGELSFYAASFFAMLYLMYFSLAEAFGGQSAGKYWLGIEVIGATGERPRIYQSLMRALFSLFFLLTGGMLAIYQTHGRLTGTSLRVIRDR